MKYKQNSRIEQIGESTLIVGADIAKNKHYARAVDFRGIELGKTIAFSQSQSGFNQLLFWIKSLMKQHSKQQVLFGIEPTGHYWLSLAEFLKKHGIKLVMVNPMHVKKSKELDDNSPTKNDVKDARVIARLVQGGRYSEPQVPEGINAELRNGMNLRDRLTQDLASIKGRIQTWLDRFFPEFLDVFRDWEGKAALFSLQHFPLPSDVQTMNAEQIVLAWRQEIKRSVGIKKATNLLEAAKASIGLTTGLSMARKELQLLLQQYLLLLSQIDELMEQLEEFVYQIPGSAQMLTIPGVGFTAVAGFLSEVGDLQRYDHPRQIQKLAGLNLTENSSGKRQGRTRITKRGRPRLRALLYRCVMVLVAQIPEFKALHAYYTKRPVNPLQKKQSMIALCCKLIRVLFVLGRKQIPYDPAKLQGALPQDQLQEVA
ncbi:IS110 family transposase [Laceyella tengchongensis]|uniref:IS110 family transposase n=1 Tax=Laceyella tengchongensis TaxID=574699 RepID=UPI0012B97F3A|nr:IS110 family transposase [Laceyella tengchongensis]